MYKRKRDKLFEKFKLTANFDVKRLDCNPDYIVGSNGSVHKLTNTGVKELKGKLMKTGYVIVYIANPIEGKGKEEYIHRLVAKNFIRNNTSGNIVNHLDGDKTNNDVTNLEWCDQKRNMNHAYEIGILSGGEQCNLSKLTEEKVVKIRKLFKEGRTAKEISEMFELVPSNVRYIVNKKTWKHVK
ncbi:DNA endonuclease [Bacillus phage vB_BceH_LY2]|nr:DNA endonuclease [Bacillus phage vB_BceH_LY2]